MNAPQPGTDNPPAKVNEGLVRYDHADAFVVSSSSNVGQAFRSLDMPLDEDGNGRCKL